MAEEFPAAEYLVLLASEQVWPNLESVANLAGSLKRVYIYHTTNERRSKMPALKLERLLREHFRLPTQRREGSMDPKELSSVLLTWVRSEPHARWVVNITGGTKLMTLGTLPLLSEPNCAVVYRELYTDWFRIVQRMPGGSVDAVPVAWTRAAADEVPLKRLLGAFWCGEGEEIQADPLDQPVPVVEIAQAVARLSTERTHQAPGATDSLETLWADAFASVLGPNHPWIQGSGPCFEIFVAGCLRALGVRQLLMRVRKKRTGLAIQEIDIVCLQSGRIAVIDCKLTPQHRPDGSPTPLGEEIRAADATRRELGGLSAVYVLVRPNRLLPEEIHTALQQADEVVALDARDFGALCRRLAEVLGMECSSAEAQAVDRALAAASQTRALPGLAKPRTQAGRELEPWTACGVLRVADWMDECSRWSGRRAVVLEFPGFVVVVLRAGTSGRTGVKLMEELQTYLDRLKLELIAQGRTRMGRTAFAIVRPSAQNAWRIAELIEQWAR